MTTGYKHLPRQSRNLEKLITQILRFSESQRKTPCSKTWENSRTFAAPLWVLTRIWHWGRKQWPFTQDIKITMQHNKQIKQTLISKCSAIVRVCVVLKRTVSFTRTIMLHLLIKADTHEGFCSRSILQGHASGAKLLRVYQRFHGYTSSSGAEFPPRKMFHDI